MRWAVLLGAVAACCAAPVAAPPSAAAQGPRALVAFLPTEPAPRSPLLFDLAERDFSFGMFSPTLGAYSKRQMVLDMSQGSRIANRAYPEALKRLDLRPSQDGGGRIRGFRRARERAEDAPGDVVPGLLADAARRAGRHVAYAGVVGFPQTEAVVAADRRGRVERVSLGTIGTFADRVLAEWARSQLVVARFPSDDVGLAQLDRVVAARRPGDLVVVLRAPPAGRSRLLPGGMVGAGSADRVLYSPTTRRVGLVAATDVAPTALDQLGVDVPDEMEGRAIETRSDGDAEDVRLRMARLDVVLGRRPQVLRWWLVGFLGLAGALWFRGGRAGLDDALRTGFLGAMWLPGVALLTAWLEPTRLTETIVLAGGSLALGRATDRLVRWPLAPAVPGLAVFAAHAIDLARGSPLVGASLAGPNPKGGARFFGIGNELEILLSLEVLFGLGALLALVPRRRVPLGFALGCLVAAVTIGSGRLGADVGGVITLGAGAAGAVLASRGRPLTRRAVAVAALVPALALGGLVALDLATGGGAHLTRTVLEGEGGEGFLDIVRRRALISVRGLDEPTMAVLVAAGVVLFAWGVRRRDDLLRPLGGEPAFLAGIWGAFAATVVGALSNDSGPVIFVLGMFGLLLATGYARGAPGASPRRAPPGRAEGARGRDVRPQTVV
ncbi:MAG TPA: hypothetical protein VF520_01965 [Thermoleophilaceae bacterium]|jgi:hypothetical protein